MMRVENLHPLAQCPKRKICDYNPIVDNAHIQVEQCAYCGRKVDYRKDEKTGRINNEKYQAVNIRKFIQPVGRMRGLFEYLYGCEPIEKNKKYHLDKQRAEQKKKEINETAREMAKFLYRGGGSL